MKKLPFVKMAGAGNDFIIIDTPRTKNLKRLAQKLCDRHSGLGGDGLLICGASKKCDFRMRIINTDGSEAEMCGNGARCLAAYIRKYKKPKNMVFSLETIAGTILGKAKGEVAEVRLSNPTHYKPEISLTLNNRSITGHYIDTGVPHTIIFVDNLTVIDVDTIGRAIRFHEKFAPRGTNVDFVEQLNDTTVAVRTYERGVEAETRACGTGAVASALIAYLKSPTTSKAKKIAQMNVVTSHKEKLRIRFAFKDGNVDDVWLSGSARFIAKGEYYY